MDNQNNQWLGVWRTRNGSFAVITGGSDQVSTGLLMAGNHLMPCTWINGNFNPESGYDLVQRKLDHSRWDMPEPIKNEINRISKVKS